MSEESRVPKRIIPKLDPRNVVVLANADALIDDALAVIEKEILKFKNKVNVGKSLDLAEARVLQGYIKSLVELSKESRERAKDEELGKMSEEQLLTELQTLLNNKQLPATKWPRR